MPVDLRPSATTDDAVLGCRLRLRQPSRGHRFGHDAILLAAACPAQAGEHVVDLGAGVGAAGLALATRVAATTVTLVEIDPDLATLAATNTRTNGLAERVSVAVLNVAAPVSAFAAAGLPPACTAHVLMNPPFNDPVRAQISPDLQRRLAHAAQPSTLETWIGAAARLLPAGGTLTLIWRADGLAEVLAELDHGFGAVAVLPVHPKPQAPAIRVLVRATKASRAPLALWPALLLNDIAGRPTPEAEAVLREAGALMPATGP